MNHPTPLLFPPHHGPAPPLPPGAPVAELPWGIDLGPWPSALDPLLPPTLLPLGALPWRRAVGHLTPGGIAALAAALTAHPAGSDLGGALAAALTAHGTPPPPLTWGPEPHQRLTLERPRIMGVVNVTPDSFSDGGRWLDPGAAVAHGLELAAAGADLLDVGGESTRPGAEPVPTGEELRRVIPVVRELARQTRVPVAVDTAKAAVMGEALAAGAAWINDVTALGGDPAAAPLLAQSRCPVVLMHMRGTPRTMQDSPTYRHVVAQVYGFLAQRLAWCHNRGIARERLVVDPGIGFGKSLEHNLALLRGLGALGGLGAPLLLGVSRKRLIGELTGVAEPAARDPGSVALALLGVQAGARIVRVHDVAATRQALAAAQGVTRGNGEGAP